MRRYQGPRRQCHNAVTAKMVRRPAVSKKASKARPSGVTTGTMSAAPIDAVIAAAEGGQDFIADGSGLLCQVVYPLIRSKQFYKVTRPQTVRRQGADVQPGYIHRNAAGQGQARSLVPGRALAGEVTQEAVGIAECHGRNPLRCFCPIGCTIADRAPLLDRAYL